LDRGRNTILYTGTLAQMGLVTIGATILRESSDRSRYGMMHMMASRSRFDGFVKTGSLGFELDRLIDWDPDTVTALTGTRKSERTCLASDSRQRAARSFNTTVAPWYATKRQLHETALYRV
jgi:hypothetical protein